MLSGAKRNRNISDFSGRLGFREKRGMTLGIGEIFNAQALTEACSFTETCLVGSHDAIALHLWVKVG